MRTLILVGALLIVPLAQVAAQVRIEDAFPSLQFVNPVDLQHAPDGSNRLFVVEQAGIIKVIENSPATTTAKVFLDIRSKVRSGGEMGLLGLTFHPNYESNGFFYVNYTWQSDSLRTNISRFTVSSNPDSAIASSELTLMSVVQPYSNHNGGQVAFGPDGYLYIALGDGGAGGDPHGHGQNRATLLGSILRINIDTPSAGRNYTIPSDNPFVGNTLGYREEIFAYGLRNPWRFSFDTETGKIWCADVGQNRVEEINIIEKGKNYGWNILEGTLCYSPSSGCDTSGLTMPLWEYGRTLGISVTGGYVYRGTEITPFVGAYVYGDFGSGRIWTLRHDGANTINTELFDTDLAISSFGVDRDNELYICDHRGKIHKFVPTVLPYTETAELLPTTAHLSRNYPNPFNPETHFEFHIPHSEFVSLKVYDLLGREVATLVNEGRLPGVYSVSWDASHLPGGVYYYRMLVGGFAETKKMMLVK